MISAAHAPKANLACFAIAALQCETIGMTHELHCKHDGCAVSSRAQASRVSASHGFIAATSLGQSVSAHVAWYSVQVTIFMILHFGAARVVPGTYTHGLTFTEFPDQMHLAVLTSRDER